MLLQILAHTTHVTCKPLGKDAPSNKLWLGDCCQKDSESSADWHHWHLQSSQSLTDETPVEAMNVHVLGKVSCTDCESYKRLLTKKLRLTFYHGVQGHFNLCFEGQIEEVCYVI